MSSLALLTALWLSQTQPAETPSAAAPAVNGQPAEVAAPATEQASDAGTALAPAEPRAAPSAQVPPAGGSEPKPRMGMIIGGWEYVWAAYGVTWAGIVLFAISLWVRRPKQAPKQES